MNPKNIKDPAFKQKERANKHPPFLIFLIIVFYSQASLTTEETNK